MSAAGPRVIRFIQTHDAGGPASREIEHRVRASRRSDGAVVDVAKQLAPLELWMGARAARYFYRDRHGARGELALVGFAEREISRIDDLVRLHDIDRAILMREPGRALGRVLSRNPWVGIAQFGALGAAGVLAAVFSALELLSWREPGNVAAVEVTATSVLLVLGIALFAAGLYVVELQSRRVPWWSRARAFFASHELPLPEHLHTTMTVRGTL